MTSKKEQIVCPVSDCTYRGAPASVAGHVSGKKDAAHDWERLGFRGANHFKRQQATSDTPADSTRLIALLGDSHIGKDSGGYGTDSWDIDPLDDLNDVISGITELHENEDTLASISLRTLVHPGDLFHNDKDGITEAEFRGVLAAFTELPSEMTPILYIRGNHAREQGQSAWHQFEQRGLAHHLSTDPHEIGNVAIYGIDHHEGPWWESPPSLGPSDAAIRILCLHQSIEPYRSPSTADFDIRRVLPELSRSISGLPEILFLGHLHQVIDDELSVEGQQVRVLSSGATTRIGNKEDSFAPGFGLLSMEHDQPRYFRVPDILE